MFSQISRFLPTKVFQNIYSTMLETLDLDTEWVSAKPMREAAFDKTFWAAHYTTMIEELSENLTRKNSTEQISISLKERLLECQDMIGRYTLSPKCYEEGIQDLITMFQESIPEDEASSLSCIATLNSIQSDFQQILIGQRDFTQDCFMGDVNHGLAQWIEGKIRASYFKQAITYYADVMALADYYDGLLKLRSHLQVDSRFSPLAEKVKQLFSTIDLLEVEQSRQALRTAMAEEGALLAETASESEAANTPINTLNRGQKSPLLDRLWAAGSGMVSYVITHSLQSITVGLAAQSAATMAFRISPTTTPTSSPSFTMVPSSNLFLEDSRGVVHLANMQIVSENHEGKLDFQELPLSQMLLQKSLSSPDDSIRKNENANSPETYSETTAGYALRANLSFSPQASKEFKDSVLFTEGLDTPQSQDPSNAKSISTDGLVAYYPFSGNANDQSGRGNHPTKMSRVVLTEDRFGNANSAYYFNGGSYIGIPTTTVLKPPYLCISVWAKRTPLSTSWQQIISATEQANRYIVGWYDNDIIGSTHSPGSIIKTPTSYVDASWHHIVLSYGEGQRLLYVDGALKANQTIRGAITGYNSGWIGIGRDDENQDGNADCCGFMGAIDDIRIYNRALTANEITDLYNEGMPLVPIKPEIGEEFRINNYIFNDQMGIATTQLTDGKFVVIWESIGQDGDSYGLFGQLYTKEGSRYNSEFRVNANTVGFQSNPAITGLLDGKFIVVWQSIQTGIWNVYGKIYNIDGTPYSEELQLTSTSYTSADASVAALNNGGFVIVWNADLSSRDVYAQTYHSDGVKYGPQMMVNYYVNDWQAFPSVASLSNGGFVVTWQSNQDGSYDIYTQVYDNEANKLYEIEFLVNFNVFEQQQSAKVATLSDGKFIIVWESNLQDDDQYGVYGQIFYPDGTVYGSERNFKINTNTSGSQRMASHYHTASLTDGKFVIIWKHNSQSVRAKIYNLDGSVYKDEFQISTYTSGDQLWVCSTISLTDDRFMVTWSSAGMNKVGYDIYGKILSIKPILKTNVLSIQEGQTITVESANLNAINGFGDPSMALNFTVIFLEHGNFTFNGVPVVNFSQQAMMEGRIKFVHDGSELPPSYLISAIDSLGAQSIAVSADIIFGNLNDAPVLAGSGEFLNYIINTGEIAVDPEIILSDSDNMNIVQAIIAIKTNYVLGEDYLRFVNHDGITGYFEETTGVLTLTGNATLTQYQTALRNVQYDNISEHPTTAPRSIGIVVNDGELNSNERTRQMTVIISPSVTSSISITSMPSVSGTASNSMIPSMSPSPTNYPPVVSGTLNPFVYTEGQGLLSIDPNLILSDPETLLMSKALLSFDNSGYVLGQDYLRFTNQNGITGMFDSSARALVLSGSATVAQYQLALRSIAYENISQNPSSGTRTVEFSVTDSGGAQSAVWTRSFSVQPMNDVPVMTSSIVSLHYVSGTGVQTLNSHLLLRDVDNTYLSNAKVSIDAGYHEFEDSLSFTPQGDITGSFVLDTGILTFTGITTLTQYQNVLRSVQYENTVANPSTETRTISFAVTDPNGGMSDPFFMPISIQPATPHTSEHSNPPSEHSNPLGDGGTGGVITAGLLLLGFTAKKLMDKKSRQNHYFADELRRQLGLSCVDNFSYDLFDASVGQCLPLYNKGESFLKVADKLKEKLEDLLTGEDYTNVTVEPRGKRRTAIQKIVRDVKEVIENQKNGELGNVRNALERGRFGFCCYPIGGLDPTAFLNVLNDDKQLIEFIAKKVAERNGAMGARQPLASQVKAGCP